MVEKSPKEAQDEPGAEERFRRGVENALRMQPRRQEAKPKAKPEAKRSSRRAETASK